MSEVNPYQYVAEQIRDLEDYIKDGANNCKCGACREDFLEHADRKLEEIFTYATKNNVPIFVTSDFLVTKYFGEAVEEDSEDYEEETSSSYEYYEEETSDYDDEESSSDYDE
jgi:hypothetical protein